MYLKRLEMAGFKSFADRTELEFVPGITAVVGPNGSGKSNVTDGIRWVLGEQSAKSLRGAKMEDVIFAGSDSRKPVGFCEVSMTFDNGDRKLPVDFTEVTVTRRVYRSGESEYLLNKRPCRLKDINELFMDTGIGKEAYSMIGQGKIEEILSSKSEDRRAIFEEAAGIVKYKARKKEAEKKLEVTEGNLARIHDLVHELQTQKAPLEEQAEKAESYRQLKDELKQVEISLYVHKIESVHTAWQQASEKVKTTNEEQVVMAAELSKQEVKLEEIKHSLSESEGAWEQVQGELLRVSEELEKLEGQRDVWIERSKNREQSLAQLQERIVYLHTEQTRIQGQKEQTRQKIEEQGYLVQEAEERLQQLQEKHLAMPNEIEIELVAVKKELQNYHDQLISLQHEEQYLTQQAEEAMERRFQLEHEQKERSSDWRMSQDRLTELQEEIKELQEQKQTIAKRLQIIETKIQELFQQEKELQGRIRDQESKANRLRSQLDVLKEMEADHSGFFHGVKEVLQARDRGIASLSGILGAVAELIRVDADYEVAVETALGGTLQHVVVAEEATGRSAIAFLKERRLGRATFLPLDVITPRNLPAHDLERLQGMDGFLGVAGQFVQSEPRFAKLVHHLLGNIIVATNLAVANQIARKIGYRYRVVTLEGDIVNPGGSMTGGSRQNKSSNLLSRGRQIEQLQQEWNEKRAIITRMQDQANKLADELENLRKERDQLRQDQVENQQNLQELIGEERQIRFEGDRNQTASTSLSSQLQQLLEKEEQADERLGELATKRSEVEKRRAILEEEAMALEEKALEQAGLRQEVQEELTESRVQLAERKQALQNLMENSERLNQEEVRLIQQEKALHEEKEILEKNKELSEEEKKELEASVLQLRDQKSEVQHRLTEVKRGRDQAHQSREDLERQVRYEQTALRKKQDELHQLEVRVNRLDVELNHLLEKLSEEYRMTFERAKEEYGASENETQAERQVRSLKQRISGLGEVNLGAIEEYHRLLERLGFLEAQEKDLLEAKQSLYQIIDQIEEEMSARFREAFDQIREHFQDVFVKMFGGGRADLQLSDPDHLLDTGIDIVAQPPGKKLQQLSLLSGGERSLAAIALLFAILRIKPVPFCFLDEVDAALDEANLTRFTRYMRQFASKTQFIVITHRKHTMEAVDVLYGITMQESGVSKLVSVRLEEYDGQEKKLDTVAGGTS
ncbi:chromosome segregation protein SMC [Risungbinella massiliensis]|uniref:chromosome segregation protein SMC n=1 Tax=Risungbinella massiliensis TaxID=1329796 RepID=UPI0005CBA534|nr:chromosome segregation protein SMC [Risungbinella massiliensis]